MQPKTKRRGHHAILWPRVRDFLGVSLDQQVAWRDDEEAFKAWRKTFLNVGIFVVPIIYVNNS
jgi:hypothetical protein